LLRVIGVASGKGGVGKTTTCINLSAALQSFDEPNIIVDANMNNANLSVQLGLQYIPVTLHDVLSREIDVFQAIRIHPSGLRIIPGSISLQSIEVDTSNLRTMLEQLDQIVFLDFPPGSSKNVYRLMKACDELIIVTNPEMTAVTDALKTIEQAKDVKKVVSGVILNRVKNDDYELSTTEVEAMCEIPVIAKIPEDNNIRKANFHNLPVVFYSPYSRASIEYLRLAATLIGKRFVPPKFLTLRRVFEVFR